MFSVTVLGSGSSGNCCLVASEQCRLLIDAGFSAKQIGQRLEALGVNPESLDGVLLTHEHGDHVAGLDIFCRRYQHPIYCNQTTADHLRRDGIGDGRDWRLFATGASFAVKDIEVSTFYIPHDAVDPVAFVLGHADGSVGFLTDLGYVPKLARERIKQVDTLIVETNHDERRLQEDTKRPWSVKQRILSRHGHLSNAAAAQLVADIAGDRLSRVILGHLSRDCNTPELALTAMHALGLDTLEIFCAEQHQPSPRFGIEKRPNQRCSSAPENEPAPPPREKRSVRSQPSPAAQVMLDFGWAG